MPAVKPREEGLDLLMKVLKNEQIVNTTMECPSRKTGKEETRSYGELKQKVLACILPD